MKTLKALVISVGLLVLALIIAFICFPIGLIASLWAAIQLGTLRKTSAYVVSSTWNLALGIDILGNAVCKDLLNYTMIHDGSPVVYKFGLAGETISSVLGKNKLNDTLSTTGKQLADLLNRLDKDHVEKAIDRRFTHPILLSVTLTQHAGST